MEPTGKSSISTERKNSEKTVVSSASVKPSGSSISTDHKISEKTVVSSASVKRNGKSIAASATVIKPNERTAVSSANPMNPDAATALSSARGEQAMLFRDVSHGPREADLMFRLIHFWEARNPNTKTLIEQEMLLIDREGTVIRRHLALTSMSSSRVFMDADVQPTRDYLEWLNSNSDIANRIAAEVVTKPESLTLEELFSYIKQDSSKVAWFECMATIDDVVQGYAWYYISRGGCNSKAVKGHTSLICNNKKCMKTEVTGVPQYLTRMSVYDKTEQAVFVILGDAGKELTGKHAAELVANYFEANDGVGADHCVPVPQALLDTIGQTIKFIVKVSGHNLTGKTQTITVTKILPPEAPLPSTVGVGSGSSGSSGDTAGDKARKAAEIQAKHPKSG
ncbi:hypothetical protein Bca101_077224 [Brassica carinata]